MNKKPELKLPKWNEHDKPILQITSEGKLIIAEGATAPDVAKAIADAFEPTEASKMRQLQAALDEANLKLELREANYDMENKLGKENEKLQAENATKYSEGYNAGFEANGKILNELQAELFYATRDADIWQTAHSKLQAENERLRYLVQVLIDNDPNDCAADAVTVLDVWRKEAKATLQHNEVTK